MSALYLRGLKQGDMQMTANGLATAALFFFLSQAKPLAKISPSRPAKTVFALSVVLSIVGQFAVHLTSLVAMIRLCEHYSPQSEDAINLSVDGKFQPNLVNSAMFLLGAVIQLNNFVVNYRGQPFTQGISENAMLWNSVRVLYLCIAVLASNILEPLNDLLQMAPFPPNAPEIKSYLALILLSNTCLAYAVEYFCRKLE
jgi:cation-transporting ATPase 13A1